VNKAFVISHSSRNLSLVTQPLNSHPISQ
jgi:hypothetical protein